MISAVKRHISFEGLTEAQNRVLAFITLGLLAYSFYFASTRGQFVAMPQPVMGDRAAELLCTLDPNAATEVELAMIPNIGPVRAAQIVAYRRRAESGGIVAFQVPEDLLKIRGIGRTLLQQYRPYLRFPSESAMQAKDRD